MKSKPLKRMKTKDVYKYMDDEQKEMLDRLGSVYIFIPEAGYYYVFDKIALRVSV